MDNTTKNLLFALLRSVIRGEPLSGSQKALYCSERLPSLVAIAGKHDLSHLLSHALAQNGLIPKDAPKPRQALLKAVYRYQEQHTDSLQIYDTLARANISFLPLKGAVMRRFYPEPWMRTSCDIDILVHPSDVDAAVEQLLLQGYTEEHRSAHDVSLYSPRGTHLELHYSLLEDGWSNNAIFVLRHVWEHAHSCADAPFRYEMTDAMFYLYHIAHMAKHFEIGGCGIRPLIDLWILDRMEDADISARDALVADCGLQKFTHAVRTLSRIWMDGAEHSPLSLQMESYILFGGVYGTEENRVNVRQQQKGGRVRYLFSRLVVPYGALKYRYPILQKHRVLFPVMQVVRWVSMLKPDVSRRVRREVSISRTSQKYQADTTRRFLDELGL